MYVTSICVHLVALEKRFLRVKEEVLEMIDLLAQESISLVYYVENILLIMDRESKRDGIGPNGAISKLGE